MAGPKKGKNKKKKGKNNAQKFHPKGEGETSRGGHDHHHPADDQLPKKPLGKKVIDLDRMSEEQMEFEVYRKLEDTFREACHVLTSLDYSPSTAHKATLGGGYIVGKGNMLSNIVKNSICYIDSHPVDEDGRHILGERTPLFDNMYELVKFWAQTLVSFANKFFPEGTPRRALLRVILESKTMGNDCSVCAEHVKADREEEAYVYRSGPTAAMFDEFLQVHVKTMENIRLTSKVGDKQDHNNANAAVSTTSTTISSTKVILNQPHDQAVVNGPPPKSSPLLPVERIDRDKKLDEWLKRNSDEKKEEVVEKMESLVEVLGRKLKDRNESAKMEEREVKEKDKKITRELNELSKKGPLGVEELKTQKKEVATSKLARMLETLTNLEKRDKEYADVEEKISEVQAESLEMGVDISAYRAQAAEKKRQLKQSKRKKEKDDQVIKEVEICDAQVSKLKQEIEEEEGKTPQITQQLDLVGEAQNKVKWRLKQVWKGKEKANNSCIKEKRLIKQGEENKKKMLATFDRQLKIEKKLLMDEEVRLTKELTTLESSLLKSNENRRLSPAASSSSGKRVSRKVRRSAQENIVRDRKLCIRCNKKEACILYLPCSHVVVCFNCSKWLGGNCLHCQVEIMQKVRVYDRASKPAASS